MSVITINLDFATDVYPYTDETDVYDMIERHRDQEIASSLVYTTDVVDTWIYYGMPDPVELGMGETITDSINDAVYEVLTQEDYIGDWYDSRDTYAATLLDRMGSISSVGWNDVADYEWEEARQLLADIATLDEDDAHQALLSIRDSINKLA